MPQPPARSYQPPAALAAESQAAAQVAAAQAAQAKVQAKQQAKNAARARAEAEADAAHTAVIAETARARTLTSENGTAEWSWDGIQVGPRFY